MSDENDDPIGDFLTAHILAKGGTLTAYVVFGTYYDEGGDKAWFSDVLAGQGSFQSLGILEAASAIERERIVRHHLDDE